MNRFFLLVSLLACFASCRCDSDSPTEDAGILPDLGPDASTPDARPESDAAPLVDCGDDGSQDFVVGEWTVTVQHADGLWTARRSSAEAPELLGVPSCERPALRFFRGEPATEFAFGNFRIDIEDAVEWVEAQPVLPRADASADELILAWPTADAGELQLRFSPRDADLLVELVPANGRDGGEVALGCAPTESFFGLGTQVTGMDLRGRTYPLWTQEQGNSKPEGGGTFPLQNIPEAAYAPMGVWHSTSGYSAVVTQDGYTELDLCKSDPAVAALRTYGPPPGFIATAGPPKQRLTALTEYVGRVRDDVPAWTFGFWVDSVTGPERLATVTQTLRAEAIPASAIWSEDWIGGSTSQFGFRLSYDWSWEPEQYPDLPTLVDGLHDDGFAFLGYFNSFVPFNTDIWPEAIANDYLVKKADGTPYTFLDPAFRNAGLVDLTNPAALDWLATYQRTAIVDIGLDGWMADFAEWLPPDALLDSGADAWTYHNLYPLAWQQANAANLAAGKAELGQPGNWIFFARSGWASAAGGTPAIAPTLWGGDQNTSWEYDDGFPTVIPIGAHAGLSGVAIYGSDIAGYNTIGVGTNTGKELWFRWASAGAFHPLMRTHHGGDECDNWNFDRDQETLDHTRRWASVHALLLPEFRRLYAEAIAAGLPITRHPWLVEPQRPGLWQGDQYQWFLGDDLLIAPVLREGATDREVALPEDGWWPLFGDAPAAGTPTQAGTVVTRVSAPPGDVPVFVRPGRALILLGEPVDSFYGATNPAVTDLEDVADSYRVALYPDPAGDANSPSELPLAVAGRGLHEFAAASATFNGAALPVCATPIAQSCVAGDVVHLVDVSAGSLVAGGATLDVDAPRPVRLQIGVSAAVWGSLADTTPLTPNPEAPSWCAE